MATANPFDLLGDDAEDPSQLIATEQLKAAAAPVKKEQSKTGGRGGAAAAQQSKPAQLPSKPLPPTQAVREARSDAPRGGRGGGRGGRGFGRGRGGGFGRDFSNDENSSAPANQGGFEEGDSGNASERRGYGAPRGPYRGGGGGGRRGGFSNGGEDGEDGRPRRAYERRSGTGRGNDIKRDGAGRGNWGTQSDDIAQVTEEVADETEKNLGDEKPAGEEDAAEGNKDSPANENEEKEPEDKEMTLEEYEKVLEEKRKALQALKTAEAKREVDTKEFASMQLLSNKKDNDEIFAKLGSDKDKRKDAFEKEEKAKKSLHIHEFLKPAEGERYYNPGGRGRGRGRGSRGGYGGNAYSNVPAPSIEDPGQFPTLGGK